MLFCFLCLRVTQKALQMPVFFFSSFSFVFQYLTGKCFPRILPHPFPRKRVARIGLISLVTLANVIASVLFIVKFGLGQHYLCYSEKRNEKLKHKLGRMVI